MRTGGHATLDIPHAKIDPTWSQDGLTYLTREARGKNHDQIGLYYVDLENCTVHKCLEVQQPKNWLYTDFSGAPVVFRTYILPGGAFWLTQLTNGYWQKCDNYFFDGSSAQARLIEAVPEYVAGVESFAVGDQDVFLLKLGLPAWDQREEAWESGHLEAMEQQEKETIIQVPSAYIDSPSEFHQVHGSANHSALGGPFRKIGDKLLYSVLEFGQSWELRSYDPVTANTSRRALEEYMNYIPLGDGQPYLYELWEERYLLTSFFGERSVSYPSRWGMPEGIYVAF